ncbi:MAG: site-2 protease family protein [Planctomyces sp.]|nr:site-2 protease family protein [Planctomyces sp.]
MRWAFKLGTIAGIQVFVHWTFLIVPAWILLSQLNQGAGAAASIRAVVFILSIFGCVLLHELGHALTARRYGVKTRDITMLPIGGVARLERIPEQPSQEFWIAVAGPAVNVAIAAVLFVVLQIVPTNPAPITERRIGDAFLYDLMTVNVALAVFNMLPAFPMDGGRVLRALLAHRMPYARATQVAATVGQMMAILFGVLGFAVGHWMLMFIALFVYIGAQEEAYMVQMRSIIKGVPARDAMITRFVTLNPDDTLQTAVDELLRGEQHDFPVVENDRVLGILTRNDLLKGISEKGFEDHVSAHMRQNCPVVQENDMLEKITAPLQESGCSTVAVVRNGYLVGVLTRENISEWMMIENARRTATDGDVPPQRTLTWGTTQTDAPRDV